MEAEETEAREPKGMTLDEKPNITLLVRCFEVFRGGTRLSMPKTICSRDTSSLKSGSGATEGVLDYGVLGRPGYVAWAGLMGPKDTRHKIFSRVRMGLSLACKASLACGYEYSFLYKPTLYNPSPLGCLYKPEGLVRRGNHNHTC